MILANLGRDLQIGTEESRAELGDKFFLDVAFIVPADAAHVAIDRVIVLPIAGAAAGITWLLDTQRQFVDWRGHWGWNFLFVLVYALIAMALADSRPMNEAPAWARTLMYVVLGIAWVFPMMPLILWMERTGRRP